MSHERAYKPLHSPDRQKAARKLTAAGWFVRIFLYGCAGVGWFLPWYALALSCTREESCDFRIDQSEGHTSVGSINKRQMAFYRERGKFADAIADLGIDVRTETHSFHYRIVTSMAPVQASGELKQSSSPSIVITISQAKKPTLQNYIGAVASVRNRSTNVIEPVSILCKTTQAGTLPSTLPTLNGDRLECPAGSVVY